MVTRDTRFGCFTRYRLGGRVDGHGSLAHVTLRGDDLINSSTSDKGYLHVIWLGTLGNPEFRRRCLWLRRRKGASLRPSTVPPNSIPVNISVTLLRGTTRSGFIIQATLQLCSGKSVHFPTDAQPSYKKDRGAYSVNFKKHIRSNC